MNVMTMIAVIVVAITAIMYIVRIINKGVMPPHFSVEGQLVKVRGDSTSSGE